MQQENYKLPSYVTSFVGRDEEIAEIIRVLGNENCRLLTLLGSGGMGKTRLAIEVVPLIHDQYFDGVLFVDLTAVQSAQAILPTIASAAQLALNEQTKSSTDQSKAIYEYFQEKQLLIILDNFEHLVEGAKHVAALLEAAPDIQIIVTSRQVLNLQSEWVRLVQGLFYPSSHQIKSLEAHHAIQLFLQRAQQYQHEFSFETEKEHVVQICRLVEGMPLAIELAATWLKTLSCEEIVKQIKQNVDFLATHMRDIPKRHRSIRAIFDKTWTQLSDTEQGVLARLSVFRGGFTQEAAQEIANATVPLLASLVDRSLIQSTISGRFRIHELLSQYTSTQLHSMNAVTSTRTAHSLYYLKLLEKRELEIACGWSQQILPDTDNIYAAWEWAVQHEYYGQILKSALSLHILHNYHGLCGNILPIFNASLTYMKQKDLEKNGQIAYAYILTFFARCMQFVQGETQAVRANYRKSMEQLNQLNALREWTVATRNYLAGPYLSDHDRKFVYNQLTKTLSISRQLFDKAMIFLTLVDLAILIIKNRLINQFDEAKNYLEEAVEISEELGSRRYAVHPIFQIGLMYLHLGDYDKAQQYMQEGVALYREMNNRLWMTISIPWLGHLAVAKKEYTKARAYYQEMLAIAQEINHKPLANAGIHDLGRLAYLQKDYKQARAFFIRTFKHDLFHVQKYAHITGLASSDAFISPDEKSVKLISLVMNSPLLLPISRDMAETARKHLEKTLPPELYQTAWEQGKSLDIDQAFEEIASSLGDEDIAALSTQSRRNETWIANSNMPDPLTERELEILLLVADGYSNKELCEYLVLSINTVRSHLKNLYSKLGVHSRTRAVATARDLGLL